MLDNVSLNQLRAFVAVHQAGSFTQAARHLGRAQSAVSHAIAALEDALGVALFERDMHKPRLTDAGRSLLADAHAIIGRTEEMKTRAKSIQQLDATVLSLAVDAFFPTSWLLPALQALQASKPQLLIKLFAATLTSGESLLLDGTCGVALVTAASPAADRDRIERRYLCEGKLVTVCAPSHPLALLEGELGDTEFERHTQLVVSDFSEKMGGFSQGVRGERNWYVGDLATKHDFLVAGLGWGSMPADRVAVDLAQGRLVTLSSLSSGGRLAPLVFATSMLRGRALTGPERDLLDHIRRMATASGRRKLTR
ncbi:MAG: LysR family transcriptional regulator [Pseudomonadota bacterium]